MRDRHRVAWLIVLAITAGAGPFVAGQARSVSYDVVVHGGRVIDPETGLDAVRDVGITGGRIAAISEQPLAGRSTLDATGLVVSPGFIDLHSHVNDDATYRLAALDGVTTALELEMGVPDVAAFYARRNGRALINYGTAASHAWSRYAAYGGPPIDGALMPPSSKATDTPLGDGQWGALRRHLEQGLAEGGLAVGMGLVYTPGATRNEVIDVFRLAAAHHVPVFVHTRSSGRTEPGSSIESVNEVIGAAAISGAALHLVHINSSCLADAPACLRMIGGARAHGLDVTVEAYPYVAGMTDLKSAFFNPGWQQRVGITEHEIAIPETGERLTPASFARYRAQPAPRLVLIYMNPQEVVDAVIRDPQTMIATDAVMQDGKGHPRAAGTFARVLAHYVRTERMLPLIEAVRKMSLMPAQRLETMLPEARRKGRLQVGADADIDVFDLATVSDRATDTAPAEPSVGFRFVLVNGTLVVRDGQVLDARPGRALRRQEGE